MAFALTDFHSYAAHHYHHLFHFTSFYVFDFGTSVSSSSSLSLTFMALIIWHPSMSFLIWCYFLLDCCCLPPTTVLNSNNSKKQQKTFVLLYLLNSSFLCWWWTHLGYTASLTEIAKAPLHLTIFTHRNCHLFFHNLDCLGNDGTVTNNFREREKL